MQTRGLKTYYTRTGFQKEEGRILSKALKVLKKRGIKVDPNLESNLLGGKHRDNVTYDEERKFQGAVKRAYSLLSRDTQLNSEYKRRIDEARTHYKYKE